jgi:hypothetical protein
VDSWIELFRDEKQVGKIIESGIALARQGRKEMLPLLLNQLNGIELIELTNEQKLALLRNYSLAFMRMGTPAHNDRNRVVRSLQM